MSQIEHRVFTQSQKFNNVTSALLYFRQQIDNLGYEAFMCKSTGGQPLAPILDIMDVDETASESDDDNE
jgi:hypothetical protein